MAALAVALLIATLAGPATAADEQPLRLLVTGDSMVQPLDHQLSRRFDPEAVKVTRDARPGTGITKPLTLDWVKHAGHQTRKFRPGAVIVFLGASDRDPLRSKEGPLVQCCRRAWIDAYGERVAKMMRAYLRREGTNVYWMSLPTPRARDWQRRFNAINLAFSQAVEDVGSRVRLVDLGAVLAPGNRYRRTLEYRGKKRVIRDKDGIHLTSAGSRIARDIVLRQMRADGLIE